MRWIPPRTWLRAAGAGVPAAYSDQPRCRAPLRRIRAHGRADLLAALAEQEMTIVDEVDLQPQPAAGTGTRGTAPRSASATLELDVARRRRSGRPSRAGRPLLVAFPCSRRSERAQSLPWSSRPGAQRQNRAVYARISERSRSRWRAAATRADKGFRDGAGARGRPEVRGQGGGGGGAPAFRAQGATRVDRDGGR